MKIPAGTETYVGWQNTMKIWMDELPNLIPHLCFRQEFAKQLENVSEMVSNKLMNLGDVAYIFHFSLHCVD